ncbi:Hypothetical protein FKW44_014895 [Caligus rogercresseyi]|uniref:Uncharacterized protein n=1 Tax=Caligus rogercresseyi TaxID=217165 RepID=A0A7T8GZJ3_CALRO|nr:Hypothetical protein FKW44_014895 [Caligus rogercresseyi]
MKKNVDVKKKNVDVKNWRQLQKSDDVKNWRQLKKKQNVQLMPSRDCQSLFTPTRLEIQLQ